MTDLRPERFDAVLAPKVRGAWYLHEATLGLPLDFFVMFSSVATIFPQPGHGSYAAANSFLDAFAAFRRRMGLAATSINWTGWVGMGLARNAGTQFTIDACAAEGLGSFDAEEATAALWQTMWANPIHATAVRIDEEVAGAQEPVPTLLLRPGDVPGLRGGEAARAQHPAIEELTVTAGSSGGAGRSCWRQSVARGDRPGAEAGSGTDWSEPAVWTAGHRFVDGAGAGAAGECGAGAGSAGDGGLQLSDAGAASRRHLQVTWRGWGWMLLRNRQRGCGAHARHDSSGQWLVRDTTMPPGLRTRRRLRSFPRKRLCAL